MLGKGNTLGRPTATGVAPACDSLMEAAWLAAFVLVPLHVEVLSAAPFEPAKVALLRGCATLALVAMLARVLADRAAVSQFRRALRLPMVVWWLVLLTITAMATLLSMLPERSLWGSWERRQGLLTVAACTTLFLAMAWQLRSARQWARLRVAIVAAGAAGALVALAEPLGLGLLAGPWRPRLAGTAGNPIFLAAALLLPIFLAAERVAAHLWHRRPAALAWMLPLAVMVAVFLGAGSRGPALGLVCGLAIAAILVFPAGDPRRRRMTLAAGATAAVLALLVLTAGAPGSPLRELRETPIVGRLLTVADLQHRTVQVRIEIWQGVVGRWGTLEPALASNLEPDPLAAIRRWSGWGPETLDRVFPPFMSDRLAAIQGWQTIADRAHNSALDALVTTGSVGLFATLALWGAATLGAMRHLRHQRDADARILGAAVTGALVATLVEWQVGIATTATSLAFAGLCAAVVTMPRFSASHDTPHREWLPRGVLLATLLAVVGSAWIASSWLIPAALMETPPALERAATMASRAATSRTGLIALTGALGVAVLGARGAAASRRSAALMTALAVAAALLASLLPLGDLDAAVRLQLGSLLRQAGRSDEAIAVLDDALARRPPSPQLAFAAGTLHATRADETATSRAAEAELRAAIAAFDRAVAADALDPSPWAARSAVELRLAGLVERDSAQDRLTTQALTDATNASQLHPRWPQAQRLRAQAALATTGSSSRE